MSKSNIVIAGGGIGGLTAATALARAGFPVTLLEAAPAFGEIGAGVTLSPNAMKGMAFIALEDAVAAAGVEPTRQRIQHWEDSRVLLELPRANSRERFGAPYVYVHRADLHALLVEAAAAAGVKLHTNAEVVEVVDAGLKTRSGTVFEGDIVVGADGLKSCVRALFDPAPPAFTGHVAWRALVPVSERLRGLASWPGVHIGPGRMVVRYPVRNEEVLNLVFFARQAGWNEEGWTIPASPEDLRVTYDGWCPDVQDMIDAAGDQKIFKWAINARSNLDCWVLENRITLLGDAAHAMTPFLGQGAACAIEDAVVLSRALADSPTAAEGLSRYANSRMAKTALIQAESNANADRLQGDDTNLYGLGGLVNEETLGLFAYDCRTTPI